MVMIPLTDLEALFQQVRDAGERADGAERRLRELTGENRLLREQVIQAKARLTKARDDFEGERRRAGPAGLSDGIPKAASEAQTVARPPAVASAPSRESTREAAPPASVPRPTTGTAGHTAPARTPDRPPRVTTEPPARTDRPPRVTTEPPARTDRPQDSVRGSAPTARPGGSRSDLGPLATELRRLYHCLQAHQRATPVDSAEERRWAAELAAYDEALQAACRLLGLTTGVQGAGRLDGAERVRLTRELGAAGLDVRVK
jgi:hypothetical protein